MYHFSQKQILYSTLQFQAPAFLEKRPALCFCRDPSDDIKSSLHILVNNQEKKSRVSHILIVFPFQGNLDKLERHLSLALVWCHFACAICMFCQKLSTIKRSSSGHCQYRVQPLFVELFIFLECFNCVRVMLHACKKAVIKYFWKTMLSYSKSSFW